MSSWQTKKLGDIAKIYDGTHQTPIYVESGIPFYSVEQVTANNFDRTKYIAEDVYEKERRRVVIERGDILMTRIGDIGTARYIDWNPKASFYVSLALIKPTNINGRFLSYVINSPYFQKELWKRSLTVAFPYKINLGDIGKSELLVPKQSEQERIVKVLEVWDEYIEKLERKIELQEQSKRGLIQQLLTGSHHTNDITLSIADIFDFLSTYSHSKAQMTYATGKQDGIYCIHYGDIHTKFNSYIDLDKMNVPYLLQKERIPQSKLLKEGDVIVTDASEDYDGVGNSVEIENLGGRQCIAGLHTFALRPKKELVAKGYGALIFRNSEVHRELMKIATYSKVYGVTKTGFSQIRVSLPPIGQQEEIVKLLKTLDNNIYLLKNKKQKLTLQKKYLLKNLITGTIRTPENLKLYEVK